MALEKNPSRIYWFSGAFSCILIVAQKFIGIKVLNIYQMNQYAEYQGN